MKILLFVLLLAQSSQVIPKDEPVAKQSPASQANQTAQPVPPPITVTVVSPTQTEDEKRKEAEGAERNIKAQETTAEFTRLLFWLGLFQLVTAVVAVIAALKATTAARDSADSASASNRALTQADTHFRIVERGYATMCHTSPLQVQRGTTYQVRLEIRNTGNTPVAVEYAVVRLTANVNGITEWPERTERDMPLPGGLLVRDKHYSLLIPLTGSAEMAARIANGQAWLIGWVIYTDAFNQRYRSGYCRRAIPTDLVWDDASARHNYDQRIDNNGKAVG